MKLLWVVIGMAIVTSDVLGGPVKQESPPRKIEAESASIFEEIGGNFEGDMLLSPEQENAVKNGYTASIGEFYKWPNNIVPYVIDKNLFTVSQQNSIVSALQQIELVSCVRFVPRTNEKDYVMVKADAGCFATVGHRGGQQTVNLHPSGCMTRGTIIHEFLHALGFWHMHTAYDRDFYVDINYDAIPEEKKHNFDLLLMEKVDDYGIPYDYDSVMHYPRTAFSANGQDTIIPKQPGVTIGQRVGLSYKDIKRLNMHYPKCY